MWNRLPWMNRSPVGDGPHLMHVSTTARPRLATRGPSGTGTMSHDRSLAELRVLVDSLVSSGVRGEQAQPWWYVDDEEGVRWAVRISGKSDSARTHQWQAPRIVFTSSERQVSAVYTVGKQACELTPAELNQWLRVAKGHYEATPRQPRPPSLVAFARVDANG